MQRTTKIIFLTAALTVSSCTSNNETADPTTQESANVEDTKTTVDSITTDETRQPYQPLDATDPESRYISYSKALDIALGPPVADPDFEPLQDLVSGPQAEADKKFIQQFADKNLVLTFPEDSVTRHQVSILPGSFTEKEGQTILLKDCHIDDSIQQSLTSDETFNDDLETHDLLVEMTYTNGKWRVTGVSDASETKKGIAECET